MTILNIANVWDMLKCPNNAIFRECDNTTEQLCTFFPFFKGGEFSLFFFSKSFFKQNFHHVPLMRKGIQCGWI